MKRSAGFSLLEVVIALGVSSVGLSAVCAMLIATAAGTSSLSQQATARWLRARPKAEWSLAPDADPERLATHGDTMVCDHQLACSPTAFMARNYADWQRLVTRMLPGGSGHVCRDSTPGDGEGKVTRVPVGGLLGEAIRRIGEGKSVSSLFDIEGPTV